MPIYKTDKKKDGLQQYRVRVAYTDPDGKHRQVERTVYGAAAAKDMERRLQDELSAPPALPPLPSRTVQNLFDEYIAAKASEVRAVTLAKSRSILKNHILPELGATCLDELNAPVLQRWKNRINEKDLGIKAKQNTYRELRTMLNYAVKMELLLTNPLLRIGNFRDAYEENTQEKLHYYTAEQFKLFIAEAKKRDRSLMDCGVYVFFCLAYYTGMRKGEINALKWTDIDGNRISVRRSVCQKIKGQQIEETPPKNKSSYRTLQMPAPLIAILEAHKARQQQDTRWTEEYRICGGPYCISDSTLSVRNAAYADAAGLPHIRIHDFRHSHASLLCNEGINIQEIARRLGHSNIEQTWSTYAHLYPREEERAVSVLDRIEINP